MKTEKILDSTLIAFLDKYSDMQDSAGTNLKNSIKKAWHFLERENNQ